MARSKEENSHSLENRDDERINITRGELRTLIDSAVSKAVEERFREYSETNSKASSIPHSKSVPKTHSEPHNEPPSKNEGPKKNDDRHSSNEHSVPSKKQVFDNEPRTKSCTYKYFVSYKPQDFTGEKGAVDCMVWLDKMDAVVDISGCAERDVVKYVSQSFKGEALAWWKSLIQANGKSPLYGMSREQFVALIMENYCPQHEVERIESDFLSLVMTNLDCQAYLTNFNTLSRLVPYLVTPEPKRIARFIGGLAPEIKASVKASRPATFRSAADLSLSLTLDVVRNMAAKASDNGRRKREDENSHRSDRKSTGFKRDSQQSVEKTKCETCRKYHLGKCRFESQPLPCGICKSQEHKTLDCKELKDATCYGCNEKGHIKTNCLRNQKKPEEAKRTNE
ncbi:putative transcription factor interactor and regulator CCHC(Zn) family [Helianthus annuus]|nr:putative transcription factor interactor and regulator CCHC(Zn) family [Helianthus annuus]